MGDIPESNQPFATPQEALAHYGVKGMKWGVRKETPPSPPPGELILSQECKNGTQLNVYKDDRFSDDVDVKAALYHAFEFRDRSGAKVGQASFYKEKAESTSLELEWIGVDKDHRSNGYARAALNGVIEYSKQNGITDLEMSATKMGQPLYESLGFTRVPGKAGTDRRVLGVFKTLPRYQLHIPAEVAHSGSVKSLLSYIVKAVDNDPELNHAEHSEPFDDALVHYGVKGMKWGVRKKDDASPKGTKLDAETRANLEAEFEEFGKAIREDLTKKGVDSNSLREKYGPPSESEGKGTAPEEGRRGLSTADKVKIGLGVAAVGYLGYTTYQATKTTEYQLAKTRMKVYSQAKQNGLDLHWDKGVDLPAGTIFPRISTVKEELRDGGFYSAFRKDDVERYKAVLPAFWPEWGIGSAKQGGYINNYRAKEPIKAPSGKESLEIFKDVLMTNNAVRMSLGVRSTDRVSDLPEPQLRQLFQQHSANWVANGGKTYSTQAYFSALKARGYNATIDFNDAGTLSHSPMRLLDSSIFEISSTERLDITDMHASAQKVLASLKHFLEGLSTHFAIETPEGEPMERIVRAQQFETPSEALAHYGVKGMRWGVRKEDRLEGVSSKTNKEAAKDAQEFARAKMFYGQGAGNRRKLIKATVESKASKDPSYRKAFEHHLAKQDLGQHASKARKERRRKDTTAATGKTVRGAHRQLTGGYGTVPLAGAVLAGGLIAAKRANVDQILKDAASQKYNNAQAGRNNKRAVDDLLRDMGMK